MEELRALSSASTSALWQSDLKTTLLSEPFKLRRGLPRCSDREEPKKSKEKGMSPTPLPLAVRDEGITGVIAEEVEGGTLVFLEGAEHRPEVPFLFDDSEVAIGGALGEVAMVGLATSECSTPFLEGGGATSPEATFEGRVVRLINLAL